MKVQKLTDTQTNKTVYSIVSALGGCYAVYKSRKTAERVMSTTSPAMLEYWAQSVSGSVLHSYATGRYRVINA